MRIIQGDALTELKRFETASFDACLCDPPYGLSSSETRNMRRMSPRKSSRDKASGFMGMAWDARVPGVDLWSEVLRALKPGSPILVFGGARTFHRLACNIEDAGFILTDTLCWLYGQGFPKGRTQLKPAWEPITLAFSPGPRRRLSIDECRITGARGSGHWGGNHVGSQPGFIEGRSPSLEAHENGRWPANVLLDQASGAQLDAQTGRLTSGANPAKRGSPKTRNVFGVFPGQRQCRVHRGANSGGASRFFYCAKASASERGEDNAHPTVKPLKLLEYLARLILPDGGGELLVPFAGSGSEMLAASSVGWKVTGIEREKRYVQIARARLRRSRDLPAEDARHTSGLQLRGDIERLEHIEAQQNEML